LARIKLKDNYLDGDIIPFDNILALTLAGQKINAEGNNDVQTATYKTQMLDNIIERENSHKRVNNGQPIEVYQPLSAGIIKNII